MRSRSPLIAFTCRVHAYLSLPSSHLGRPHLDKKVDFSSFRVWIASFHRRKGYSPATDLTTGRHSKLKAMNIYFAEILFCNISATVPLPAVRPAQMASVWFLAPYSPISQNRPTAWHDRPPYKSENRPSREDIACFHHKSSESPSTVPPMGCQFERNSLNTYRKFNIVT